MANEKPKFNVSDIVRYADGSTALMRIAYISTNHGGPGVHRYYGQQCMGGSCGAYEERCSPATASDAQMWDRVRVQYPHITPWDKFPKDRGLVGAVED